MRANNKLGFTIVELTLAIAFIGILLIAVVTVAVGMGRTYQKGMTLRDVNQAGREVSDAMRRDIAAASPSQLEVLVLPNATNPETARICTGSVSYLINFAGYLNNPDGQIIKDSNSSTGAKSVHLSRVVDTDGSNCQTNASGQYATYVVGTNQRELLGAVDCDSQSLAVHGFSLDPVADQSSSMLYRLFLRIGTNQLDSVDSNRCKNPNDTSANFDFCALYDFDTIIRAGYRSAN